MFRAMPVSLNEVLSIIDQIPWDQGLYTTASEPSWNLNMPVMILEPECVEHEMDEELCYLLTISDVQDVIENLKLQVGKNVSRKEMASALEFYYHNDAYVVLV